MLHCIPFVPMYPEEPEDEKLGSKGFNNCFFVGYSSSQATGYDISLDESMLLVNSLIDQVR